MYEVGERTDLSWFKELCLEEGEKEIPFYLFI